MLVVVPLMTAAPDLLVQGCAMCKAVAEGESNVFGGSQPVGRGLNSGILYLMAVPYVLLFLVFRKRVMAFFRELAGAQG